MDYISYIKSLYPTSFALLAEIFAELGYEPTDEGRFVEALTHSSAAKLLNHQRKLSFKIPWNERLEFLGDSVLGLVISAYLVNHKQRFKEGELSKIRAGLVNEQVLVTMCKKLRLDQCLILGTHEEVSGGRTKPSLLADAFEAFIGALFLDGGYEVCEEKILVIFNSHLKKPLKKLLETDYKSRLQEKIQSLYKELPTYKLVSQVGPDHQKQFEVEVKFRKQTLGIGSGESKKTASQQAAKNALNLLDQPDFQFPDQAQEINL